MSDSTVVALHRHNADYGFDGSFHRPSPRAQGAFWATVSAALTAAAGVSAARGRPGPAALATAHDSARQLAAGHARRRGAGGRRRRAEVDTADITDLPFDDDSVDVIVSSLVVHNLPGRAAREQAIREAARVLRPGGLVAIADLGFTRQYARQLRDELGWADVRRRNLGWRIWWGGPWFPTHLVTANTPAA